MKRKKNRAAVSLGRLGGKAGRGESKSRTEQIKAWWAGAGGEAERAKRELAKSNS